MRPKGQRNHQGPGRIQPHPKPSTGASVGQSDSGGASRDRNRNFRRDHNKPPHNQKDRPRPSTSRGEPAKPKNREPDGAAIRAAALKAALAAEEKSFKHIPKAYGVLFYDTLAQAHQDMANISQRANEPIDQLNIVIRAESNMDDPVLLGIPKVKIFAGAAWTLIHERRLADGWYKEPQ